MKVKYLRQKLICLIPPLAVMLILCIIFKIGGLYPFGNLTISWCDMNQQVVPLLLDFKDILSGKGNMFYSLGNAGGMNFWGVFFFFLSSPFSFLVAFVEKNNLLLFMNIFVILKLMTSAFTASIYFKRCHKALVPEFNVILSVMYALCGYGMLFYQNNVWLDMMYLLPLLLISFNKLILERKLAPYITVMTAMLVVNYYISYMVVIFTIIFFGLHLLIFRTEDRKIVIRLLCLGSGAVALLSGIVWVPSLLQYFFSGRGSDIITGLIKSSFFTATYTALPLLFCTAFIFTAVAVTMIKGWIKNKQTFFYIILFILMLIPVFIEPINKMWHTGNYMSFPVRYGFITIFIGLTAVATILSGREDRFYIKQRERPLIIVSLTAITLGFAWFAYFYFKENKNDLDAYVNTLWGNKASFFGLLTFFAVTAACYMVVYIFYDRKLVGQKPFIIFISIIMLVECSFSINVYMVSAKNNTSVENYRSIIDLSNKIDDSDGFFRVKSTDKLFDVNLMGGLGYNSLSHYTSLTSEDYMFTMKKLGYSSYWMEVGTHGGTEFSDALLSNKYIISKAHNMGAAVYSNGEYSINKEEFYLPLGIISRNDLTKQSGLPAAERIDIQKYIFKNLFASDKDLFIKYPYSELADCTYTHYSKHSFKKTGTSDSIIKYNIYAKGEQTLYFDCFDGLNNSLIELINGSFDVAVNGVTIQSQYPSQSNNGILRLGTFEDENITIEIRLLKDISSSSFGVYGLQRDVLKAAVKNVDTVNMSSSGSRITGTYTAKSNEYVYLSIPYDKGFTVKINGHKANYYKVYSDFIALKLNKGINQIIISYVPDGFNIGLELSIVGILTIIASVKIKKRKLGNTNFLNNVFYGIFLMVFCTVLALIYIVPLCLNVLY